MKKQTKQNPVTEEVLALVTKANLYVDTAGSALGLAHTWIEKPYKQLFFDPTRDAPMLENRSRDDLAKGIIAIFESHPEASKEDYFAALAAARNKICEPHRDPWVMNRKIVPLDKPKVKKAASSRRE